MTSRDALLDQIAYLADELAMLGLVVARVPETLHRTRALDGHGHRSLREVLALLAARDAARRNALATRADAPEDARPEDALTAALAARETPVPSGADDAATDALLAAAIAAREAFHAAAAALDAAAFARAAAGLHAAVLDDAAVLRALAEQFHDAQGLRA